MMRAVVALVLTALLSQPAEATELTPDQMRDLGLAALLKGYADQSLAISDALLQRDPSDSAALTLKAQALRVKGDLPGSEAAARAAWAARTDGATGYGAATALAQALSLQDHRTAAQYWLRQAVEQAPTAETRGQAVQDFNYVRSQNPLTLQVDLAVRPSDNVNNGASDPFFQFGPFLLPLPESLIALSGTAWNLGLSGEYKLADNGPKQQALTFGLTMQGAALDAEGRQKAPKTSNADFTYAEAEFGWQQQADLSFGRLTTAISAGHSWYARQDLADSLTASLMLDHPISDDLVSGFGATLTRQMRLDRAAASSTDLNLDMSLTKSGPEIGAVRIRLGLLRAASEDAGTDRKAVTLSLDWQAAEPVAGFSLGANASVRRSFYENSRLDTRSALGLSATVNRITYLGFSPVISLDASQTTSNVPWFNAQTTSVGLSLKSRF